MGRNKLTVVRAERETDNREAEREGDLGETDSREERERGYIFQQTKSCGLPLLHIRKCAAYTITTHLPQIQLWQDGGGVGETDRMKGDRETV